MGKVCFEEIEELRKIVEQKLAALPGVVYARLLEDFDVQFSHESTKIEGNTLSISEVKTLLVDGYMVAGKALREAFEVVNHKNAYYHILAAVEDQTELTEAFIKDVHEIVMQNIMIGGIYRNVNVRISGATFLPPEWSRVWGEMEYFLSDYEKKREMVASSALNPIALAAWVHAEFVRIHPFADGNGRTARLLMNFILLKYGFQPVIIRADQRPEYYDNLNAYALTGDLSLFYEMVLNSEMNVLESLNKEFAD